MPNEPRGPLGVPLRPPLQGSEAMRLVRREVRSDALLALQLVNAAHKGHAAHRHKVTDISASILLLDWLENDGVREVRWLATREVGSAMYLPRLCS